MVRLDTAVRLWAAPRAFEVAKREGAVWVVNSLQFRLLEEILTHSNSSNNTYKRNIILI